MTTDLELSYEMLTAKKPIYDTLWDYYRGHQPLVYSRKKLEEIFSEINARFTQNWCAVVVDSVIDRIQMRQFTVNKNEPVEQALNQLLERTELMLEADDVHLASLVTGEAFVIAWPDENDVPQAYYNDPRLCHAFYEAENPRVLRLVPKWWRDDEGYIHMTLYYRDRLEYYITKRKVVKLSEVSSGKAFVPMEMPVAENPYGIIPAFHFRREHRSIQSELGNVIEPQDAINKLLNDMMIAAEFGAFRQRWIITNSDTRKLKNSPNEIWRIPTGDREADEQTQVGEFGITDLANYIQGIDKFSNAIAIITRTPKHYFFGQGGDPSGESLIALEAPLNKKTQKYIDRFASTWRHLGAFMLLLQGVTVDPFDVAAVFDKPETIQPRTEAEIRKMGVEAGLPLVTLLRDDGWTDAEIETMQDDKKEEQEAQQAQLGTALVGAMRNFDQGGAGLTRTERGMGKPVTAKDLSR